MIFGTPTVIARKGVRAATASRQCVPSDINQPVRDVAVQGGGTLKLFWRQQP